MHWVAEDFGAFRVWNDGRAGNLQGGAVFDVTFRDNTLNGDDVRGCELAGVTCSGNV